MRNKEQVLVGMDMSHLDAQVIEHINYFMKHPNSNIHRLYFFNVIKNLNIPDEVLNEFPDIVKNALAEREQKMKEVVQQHLKPKDGVKVDFIIKKGPIPKVFIKTVRDLEVDWIVMGRREKQEDSGLLAQKLARRADSSLIIIPEGVKPGFKKALVPVDYSEYSEYALKKAIDLAYRFEAEIVCQNVYEVPTGYHYSGKTFEEFGVVMRNHAEKSFEKFIKKIDTKGVKITRVFTLDDEDEPVRRFYQTAKQYGADSIIVGAKGMSSTTAFFIGSSTEKLIQWDSEFPLFVLRPPGKMTGFLELLKGL